MGIVTFGIPQDIVIELARLNGSSVFVETGTHHGGTTRWASRHFDIVHTIERAEHLYKAHSGELAQLKGVTPHLGDSREVLPKIISGIRDQRAVYWLDGHWTGGETAGEHDECPMLDELACLSNRTQDIILVDDARLFLCAPPPPHNPSHWPTVPDIVNALPYAGSKQFVQIVDDVIFIIPNEPRMKKHLVEYTQRRAFNSWEESARLQRGEVPLTTRIRGRVARMFRRMTPGS